jgi:hypothetical protein
MILSNKPFGNCLFFEQQVVGWGLDDFGKIADKLKIMKLRVVSLDTCVKSDINFFSIFMHETTFCAGFKNGIFMFRQ